MLTLKNDLSQRTTFKFQWESAESAYVTIYRILLLLLLLSGLGFGSKVSEGNELLSSTRKSSFMLGLNFRRT